MKTKTAKSSDISEDQQTRVSMQLSETLATATAVLAIIEDVVPRMNKLVEDNVSTVSESFSKIAISSKAIGKYFEFSGTSDVSPMVDEIQKNVGNAIMGLQFQDRLSQNLIILKNISEVLHNNIKDAINLKSNENGSGRCALNLDLSQRILENLKLGEVREVFVNYLLSTGLIKDKSELGIIDVSEDQKKQLADDIELF